MRALCESQRLSRHIARENEKVEADLPWIAKTLAICVLRQERRLSLA